MKLADAARKNPGSGKVAFQHGGRQIVLSKEQVAKLEKAVWQGTPTPRAEIERGLRGKLVVHLRSASGLRAADRGGTAKTVGTMVSSDPYVNTLANLARPSRLVRPSRCLLYTSPSPRDS